MENGNRNVGQMSLSEFLHLKMESDLLLRRIMEARLNICYREYGGNNFT